MLYPGKYQLPLCRRHAERLCGVAGEGKEGGRARSMYAPSLAAKTSCLLLVSPPSAARTPSPSFSPPPAQVIPPSAPTLSCVGLSLPPSSSPPTQSPQAASFARRAALTPPLGTFHYTSHAAGGGTPTTTTTTAFPATTCLLRPGVLHLFDAPSA